MMLSNKTKFAKKVISSSRLNVITTNQFNSNNVGGTRYYSNFKIKNQPPSSTTQFSKFENPNKDNNNNNSSNNGDNNNNNGNLGRSIGGYLLTLGLGFTVGFIGYKYCFNEDYLFSSHIENVNKEMVEKFNHVAAAFSKSNENQKSISTSKTNTSSPNDSTTSSSSSPSEVKPTTATTVIESHPHSKADVIENISELVQKLENKLVEPLKKVESAEEKQAQKEVEQVFEKIEKEGEEATKKLDKFIHDKVEPMIDDLLDEIEVPKEEEKKSTDTTKNEVNESSKTTTFITPADEYTDTSKIYDTLDSLIGEDDQNTDKKVDISIQTNEQDNINTTTVTTTSSPTSDDLSDEFESSSPSTTTSPSSTPATPDNLDHLLGLLEKQYINQIKELILENVKLKEEIESIRSSEKGFMEKFEDAIQKMYSEQFDEKVKEITKESIGKLEEMEKSFKQTLDQSYDQLNDSVKKQRDNLTSIFESQKKRIQDIEADKKLISALTVALVDLKRAVKDFDAYTPLQQQIKQLKELTSTDVMIDTVVKSLPTSVSQYGVASLKMIRDNFEDMSSELRKESLLPDDQSFLGRALSTIASKLIVPEKGMVEGDDIDSTLARAQEFLKQGDLSNAIREVEGINKRNPHLSDLTKEWTRTAKDRMMVDNVVKVLESRLKQISNDLKNINNNNN